MEIIKIMNAVLAPCQTDGEYQWAESSECAYGRSWEGDVRGYLEAEPENLRKNPRLLHIISCLSLEVKEEKI